MSVMDVIGAVFKPLADLVSEFVEDKDKSNEIRSRMYEAQIGVGMQMLDYEKRLLDAQSNIIVAEAQGQSWIQRSWRPITMLTFLGLVVLDSFGWLANPLAPQAWTLLQIGLGGYVAGRSLEKIAPQIKDAFARN